MISVNIVFELVSNKISIVTFNIMTMMSVENIFEWTYLVIMNTFRYKDTRLGCI